MTQIELTGIPKNDPWTRAIAMVRCLLSPENNPLVIGMTKIRWSSGIPGYFDPNATVDAEYTILTEATWQCIMDLKNYRTIGSWEAWNMVVVAAECYTRMRILMEDFGVAVPPPMEPAVIPYAKLETPFENLVWRKMPSCHMLGFGLLVPYDPVMGLHFEHLCRSDQTDQLPLEHRPIARKI